jgi:hypothetical protein
MAIPTLEKTWQYNVNQAIASVGTADGDMKKLVLAMKNSLTGFSSSPWTVVRSSNGTTVAASDLWTSVSAMVNTYDGSAHSWIVLEQTGVTGGPFQLCIDLNYSGMYQMSWVYSPTAGFTVGGTTTARPTASDQTVLVNAGTWINDTGISSKVLHVMMSADGQCTRVYTFVAGIVSFSLLIETLADTSATLTSKAVATLGLAYTSTNFYNNAYWHGRFGSTHYVAFTATEGYKNGPVPSGNSGTISDFTSAFAISPLSAYSETGGCHGRAGRFVDLYMGAAGAPNGSTYPLTPNDKEFVQFSQFVMPWNGTAPLMA